jgi:hypothetical protein
MRNIIQEEEEEEEEEKQDKKKTRDLQSYYNTHSGLYRRLVDLPIVQNFGQIFCNERSQIGQVVHKSISAFVPENSE